MVLALFCVIKEELCDKVKEKYTFKADLYEHVIQVLIGHKSVSKPSYRAIVVRAHKA